MIMQLFIKGGGGGGIKAINYNLSSMLFLLHKSMEIQPQKENSKLTGKEYENGERKKRKY